MRQGHTCENVPLFQGHDRRPLILENGFIGMHADVQLIAQLPSLHNGASVSFQGAGSVNYPHFMEPRDVRWLTVVEEVKAAIDPEPAFQQLGSWIARGQDLFCDRHVADAWDHRACVDVLYPTKTRVPLVRIGNCQLI